MKVQLFGRKLINWNPLTESKTGVEMKREKVKVPLKLYIVVSYFWKRPSLPKELFAGISSGTIRAKRAYEIIFSGTIRAGIT
jgi:hypothetical protein